jgi:hypothetical protein
MATPERTILGWEAAWSKKIAIGTDRVRPDRQVLRSRLRPHALALSRVLRPTIWPFRFGELVQAAALHQQAPKVRKPSATRKAFGFTRQRPNTELTSSLSCASWVVIAYLVRLGW